MKGAGKMQRAHFILIAETIRNLEVSSQLRSEIAGNFANMCRKTNPAFDWSRFMEACKTDAEKEVEADGREEKGLPR